MENQFYFSFNHNPTITQKEKTVKQSYAISVFVIFGLTQILCAIVNLSLERSHTLIAYKQLSENPFIVAIH